MPGGPESPGPGVDAQGRPVEDPTTNVIALNEAAVRRMDDLRQLEAEHQKDLLAAQKEMVLLLAKHQKEMADLRGEFGEKLRKAETARIDAIRAVDVGAVQRAAEVAATQAQTLASQVTVSADTLRAQVSVTQQAGAVALAAALDPIQKSIDDLRRAQYEAQGKTAQVVESRGGNSLSIAVLSVSFMFMLVVIGIASFIIAKP